MSSKELLCVCKVLFAIPDGYQMNKLVRSVRMQVASPSVVKSESERQTCTSDPNGAICRVQMNMNRKSMDTVSRLAERMIGNCMHSQHNMNIVFTENRLSRGGILRKLEM